ncbi:MAG: hypothetical protein JST17_11155 [Bacteroidetes bacterium]|nr:hypothetical protein [Bacteroidota bacterium]MBS1930221.1 hypothetical protein [Bacteroidota bacterium]
MSEEIISKIWEMNDPLALTGVKPGLLLLKEGNVSFVTEEGEQFNVPVAELKEVKWPFYELGLSFTTHVNGKKYRFIFTDPVASAGENILSKASFLPMLKFISLSGELDTILTGKEAAHQWKAVFKK